MVFAPHDLLADPPFTGLDLVTCRNLLVYLEPAAADRVVYLIHSSLRLGGYLLLGKGESLSSKQRGFEELAPGRRIYPKVGRAAKVEFEFPRRPLRLPRSRSTLNAVEAHAHETTAATHELPAVLVDENFLIVRLYGDAAPFLRFRPGKPTLNLPALLARGFGAAFESAAQEAVARQSGITVGGLADPATGEPVLGIRVTPLDAPNARGSRLLVSFIRGHADASGSDTELPGGSHSGEDMDWTEALRLSHEELEASREELQALNEELRAANDQLNLTNDELATANAQLGGKIEELETQSNVLSAGAVMTLFLDHELRVRWFTPAVSALFPLTPGDTGRRITDFATRFTDPSFLPDIHSVMSTGEPSEGEIRSIDGHWYLKRIRPFRTRGGDGAGSGVAITFTDISELKTTEALRESEAQLRAVLDIRTVGVIFFDFFGGITDANDAFLTMVGFTREDLRAGRVRYEELTPPEWLWKNPEVLEELKTRGESTPFEKECFRQDGSRIWIHCFGKLLSDQTAVEFIVNITERKRAEAAQRDSEQTLRRNQIWLAAQKEAFQAAMNGAPLETSLGILVRAAVEQAESERRCAFYIADLAQSQLRHVVGMPESYAHHVDGFVISPESLACGLAVSTGTPVVTPDVLDEPRWHPWTWLAREYDYRGCWSFPVETSMGKLVGSFAMYFRQPHEPTPRDRELAAALTHAGAIIISHHQETEARAFLMRELVQAQEERQRAEQEG
jgi:two-component system CheB/CheR fusion protein